MANIKINRLTFLIVLMIAANSNIKRGSDEKQ